MTNSKNFVQNGTIYVVATPIGNLEDLTPRAQQVLKTVDLIAAEDTRHSKVLLNYFQISTLMTSYHEHNEPEKAKQLLEQVKQGKSLAIISDAGTPLISDPGFRIIQLAHQLRVPVVPVPGCCAAIAALSVAGIASDKFLFLGFLSANAATRSKELGGYTQLPFTLVIYESCHRILALLNDLKIICADRKLTLARELTKTFETILQGTVSELYEIVQHDLNQQKGEFVLVLAGADIKPLSHTFELEIEALLKVLLKEMPLKKAVSLVVQLTQLRKNDIYAQALKLQQE